MYKKIKYISLFLVFIVISFGMTYLISFIGEGKDGFDQHKADYDGYSFVFFLP